MVSRIFIRTSAILLSVLVGFTVLISSLIFIPNTPLPDAWNPRKPLTPLTAPNFLTPYKMRFAINDFGACQRALTQLGANFIVLPDKVVSDQCHIRDQVQIKNLSHARVSALKTTCGMALRLTMWEYHHVQPTAKATIGKLVNKIDQIGSYNCREIRSANGPTDRMSEHATANAVDISGFQLSTGERISVLKNWNGTADERQFMRRVRDGGCGLFRITLSPEYNDLHADHFHFDQGRWSSCN